MNKRRLNEAQERFCRLLVFPDKNGRSRSRADAYMLAYARVNTHEAATRGAYKLLSYAHVRARVDELMKEAYPAIEIERSLPIADLVASIRGLVMDDKRASARIAGLKLALQLREQYLKEEEQPELDLRRFARMSDEELMAEARRMMAE